MEEILSGIFNDREYKTKAGVTLVVLDVSEGFSFRRF